MDNPPLAARILEIIMDGVLITDAQHNILYVNPAFSAITGYTLQEVVGKNPRLLKSGRQDREFYQKMWTSLKETGQWQGEIWNRRKNGEVYPEWENIVAVKDQRGQVTHYVAIFSDITSLKHAENHYQQLAYHDPLTGLANRLLFEDRLRQALAQAQRHQQTIAVLFIDLDNFKPINDSLGHSAGDALMQAAAERLRGCVRNADTVARFGGDEFTALLSGVKKAQDAGRVAKKILRALSEAFVLQGQEIHVTASVGVSLYPGDGADVDTLVKNADSAMYRAKQRGKNNYQFYTAPARSRALSKQPA
ncbi:MAG: diguanylate cyclase [Pseudomonadota bacterium]